MSTINEARADVYDRFTTLWAKRTLVTFPNETFDPPEDLPWVRVSVKNIDGGQETLGKSGNRKYKRDALIFVQVFTSLNSGTEGNDILCEAAKTIFEGVSFNSVTANNSVIKEIGPSDGHYQQNVQTEFFYIEIK